jgi:hypothetical protein
MADAGIEMCKYRWCAGLKPKLLIVLLDDGAWVLLGLTDCLVYILALTRSLEILKMIFFILLSGPDVLYKC